VLIHFHGLERVAELAGHLKRPAGELRVRLRIGFYLIFTFHFIKNKQKLGI
jgi:hypothetical protein